MDRHRHRQNLFIVIDIYFLIRQIKLDLLLLKQTIKYFAPWENVQLIKKIQTKTCQKENKNRTKTKTKQNQKGNKDK